MAMVGMSGEVSTVTTSESRVCGPSFEVVIGVTIVSKLPSSSSVAAGGGVLDESGFKQRRLTSLNTSNAAESRKKVPFGSGYAVTAPASGFFSL
jgi:hypothetical protein